MNNNLFQISQRHVRLLRFLKEEEHKMIYSQRSKNTLLFATYSKSCADFLTIIKTTKINFCVVKDFVILILNVTTNV